MHTLINKIKNYSRVRPRRSKVIFGTAALAAILLVSTLIAVLNKDSEQTTVEKQVPTAQISVTASGFVPSTLAIKPGTKVIWVNSDSAAHQISANPHPTGASLPSLKSESLKQNQSYEYTFSEQGNIEYHDQLNPTINGSIQIQN